MFFIDTVIDIYFYVLHEIILVALYNESTLFIQNVSGNENIIVEFKAEIENINRLLKVYKFNMNVPSHFGNSNTKPL